MGPRIVLLTHPDCGMTLEAETDPRRTDHALACWASMWVLREHGELCAVAGWTITEQTPERVIDEDWTTCGHCGMRVLFADTSEGMCAACPDDPIDDGRTKFNDFDGDALNRYE